MDDLAKRLFNSLAKNDPPLKAVEWEQLSDVEVAVYRQAVKDIFKLPIELPKSALELGASLLVKFDPEWEDPYAYVQRIWTSICEEMDRQT